jgi:microcystin-dependent protein
MANIEHASLTGAALHEPKGVENADAGQVYIADGLGSGAWSHLTSTSPIGIVVPYAGSSAPSGWLLCYGQPVSRTTYSQLFAVIGTTYGVGDGSTTFNVPDLRGRVVYGKDNMGGTTAGRVSSTFGITGTTLGSAGGVQSNQLSQTHMPNYTLPNTLAATSTTTVTNTNQPWDMAGLVQVSSGSEYTTVSTNGVADTHTVTTVTTISGSVLSGGENTPFSNLSPGIILNQIIYANA